MIPKYLQPFYARAREEMLQTHEAATQEDFWENPKVATRLEILMRRMWMDGISSYFHKKNIWTDEKAAGMNYARDIVLTVETAITRPEILSEAISLSFPILFAVADARVLPLQQEVVQHILVFS